MHDITLTQYDLALYLLVVFLLGLVTGQFCVINKRQKKGKIIFKVTKVTRELNIYHIRCKGHRVSPEKAKELVLDAMNNSRLKQS